MPTIDVSNDFVVWDNTQTVTLTNPDGSSITVEYALQQGVDTVMADMGDGTLGYRTFCIWNIWRKPIEEQGSILWSPTSGSYLMFDSQNNALFSFFIPELNCKIKDDRDIDWYVANANLDVWGEKYQLECEAQAGTGVNSINLPGAA